MPSLVKIPRKVCSNVSDYKNNNEKVHDYKTSLSRLKRHAATLGNMSSYKTSKKGREFYMSFIDMILDEKLELRDDYFHAETSFLSSFSFYLGMIITKDIAEEVYKVGNLFHLKDNNLEITPKNGSHPDYFGLDIKNDIAYLFEAKGRRNKLGLKSVNDNIDKPKGQLQSIKEVTYKTKTYQSLDLKKHIVQTVFPKKIPCRKMDIWDIDPPSDDNAESKIIINEKNLVNYYKNILNFLELKNNDVIKKTLNNKEFKCIKSRDGFIGLQKDIFKNLKRIEESIEKEKKII